MREDPATLVTDPSKEIRSFRVAISAPLGTKRGRGRGAFIDSVLTSVDSFYGEVLGDLKAWAAAPPKLRPTSIDVVEEVEHTMPASLASTDYSSQDGPTQPHDVDESSSQVSTITDDPPGVETHGEPDDVRVLDSTTEPYSTWDGRGTEATVESN